MSSTFLVTPGEAKALARRLFVSYYPERDMWFDAAWEVLEESGPRSASSGETQVAQGLAAADEASSELAIMAADFVMFFEAFMTKNPILGQDLAKRVQEIADRSSANKFSRENLLKRLGTPPERNSGSASENSAFREFGNLIKEQFAATQELIKTEHKETRKTVRRPVISTLYRTNYLVTLRMNSRSLVVNTGLQEYAVTLPRVKFELLAAIAQISKPADKRGWIECLEITQTVPTWNGKPAEYVRHRIAELRDELKEEFSSLIESAQGAGYRISTHPENIFSDPS